MASSFELRYALTETARKNRLKDTGESSPYVFCEINHGDDQFSRAVDLLGIPSGTWLDLPGDKWSRYDVPASELLDFLEGWSNLVTEAVEKIDVDRFATLYDGCNGNLYGAVSDYLGDVSSDLVGAVRKRIYDDSDLMGRIEKPYRERKAREKAEQEADIKRRDEEKRAAVLAAEREKLEWIEKHGSNRLKRMVAEEIDCESVYRDERLAADRPGWAWSRDCDGSYDDPRNVPDEAFTLLDKARETEPGAELVYWSVENEVDPMDYSDYGEEPEKYAWTGYAAVSDFLGRGIVYGLPEEFVA